MGRTWLWLEDQKNTVEDIKEIINRLGVTTINFENTTELTNYLISKKQSQTGFLEQVGFILDVLIIGTPFIICPPEWCGGNEVKFYETQKGYDAGLLFYEKLMIEKRPHDVMKKPPPVLFLTVLHTDFVSIERRISNVKKEWAREHQVIIEQTKVEWVRKWDATESHLSDLFNKWGEL